MVNLEVGYTQGHHNVGCRVGFGEHILDFSTGFDIPFWHLIGLHSFDLAISLLFGNLQPQALTYPFHDGKGHLRLETRMHEVNHDIIPTTDNS